jgi:hypothetical protein
MIAGVREGVLWFLRRGLDGVVGVQREMVEKRIERVREKEKSVLYKSASTAAGAGVTKGGDGSVDRTMDISTSSVQAPDAMILSEAETARIEAQLSPEQLQLFAEENDTMLRHYEDTLGKVQYVLPFPSPVIILLCISLGYASTSLRPCPQLTTIYPSRNAEKSLLEISSLQETLVSHLATQEEYISQLVSDVDTTQSNVGRGNKELKRATERRSTAQAVFWGTVGLCTWLVVWDLVF